MLTTRATSGHPFLPKKAFSHAVSTIALFAGDRPQDRRKVDAGVIIVLMILAACLCLLGALLAAGVFWWMQQNNRATATAQAEMTASAIAQSTSTAQARATATAIARATSTAQARPTSTPRPERFLVLRDAFDYNINGWDTGSFGDALVAGSAEISDGKYRISVNRSEGIIWRWWPDSSEVGAFSISLEAQLVKGPASGACYGLAFRDTGDAFYMFEVCENGRYSIYMNENGTWDTLVDWTVARAIQYGQPNTLMVEGRGSHFVFSINDVVVNELDDNRLKKGNIGIAIEVSKGAVPAVFDFDNYTLYSFVGQ